MSLTRAVQDAKQTFKYEGPCETYLVISHARRVQINRDENLREVKALGLAPMLFVDVKATRARRASAQSFWAYVGQQLLGCTSSGERLGIRNGVAYRVKALDLQNKTMELEGVKAQLSFQQIKDYLRLSHARTYASIQGTELEGPTCLVDTAHPRFTHRHLFVGLSRCKDAKLVRVTR